ncbi:MAG: GNAT family N-acetyltransferase, partial [Alphaproteobacteria bacterium]
GVADRGRNNLDLRPATRRDVTQLIELANRSYLDGIGPTAPPGYADDFSGRGGLRGYVETDWPRIMVAERGGQIVGLCGVHDENVVALFVDPPAQRQGIGTHLLGDAVRRIGEAGHDVARLGVAEGTVAEAFYAAQGWNEVRREPIKLASGHEAMLVWFVKTTRRGDQH